MKETFGAVLVVVALMFMVFTCVDYANSKETTTLNDAINRPVKVEKFVDKENNVVCYWAQRYPKYLSCLQINDVSSAEKAK